MVQTGYMQLSDDQSADKTTKSASPYYIQTLGKKMRVSRFLIRIGNKRASPKRNGIFMQNIKHKAQSHWVQNTRDKALLDPTVINSGVRVHATDETALDIDNWQVRTKYGQSLWGFDVCYYMYNQSSLMTVRWIKTTRHVSQIILVCTVLFQLWMT